MAALFRRLRPPQAPLGIPASPRGALLSCSGAAASSAMEAIGALPFLLPDPLDLPAAWADSEDCSGAESCADALTLLPNGWRVWAACSSASGMLASCVEPCAAAALTGGSAPSASRASLAAGPLRTSARSGSSCGPPRTRLPSCASVCCARTQRAFRHKMLAELGRQLPSAIFTGPAAEQVKHASVRSQSQPCLHPGKGPHTLHGTSCNFWSL